MCDWGYFLQNLGSSGWRPHIVLSFRFIYCSEVSVYVCIVDWMYVTKKLNPRILNTVFKGLVVSPVQGIWTFLDTFRIQKCLETGKRQSPYNSSHYFPFSCFWTLSVFKSVWKQLNDKIPWNNDFSRDVVISPVSIHFLYSKVSRNSKTRKSLEIMNF